MEISGGDDPVWLLGTHLQVTERAPAMDPTISLLKPYLLFLTQSSPFSPGRRQSWSPGNGRKKIGENRRRDLRNHSRLRRMGWRAQKLWEHKVIGDFERYASFLQSALEYPVAKAPKRKRNI
jgi:hypothetical protein